MKRFHCLRLLAVPSLVLGCITIAMVAFDLRTAWAQEQKSLEGQDIQDNAAFDKRLNSLQRANPETRGRDNLVAAGERLLSDFPDHPRRAEAMLRIAELYGLANPKAGCEENLPKSVEWFGHAVDAAKVGDDVWCKANLGVSNSLRRYTSGRSELTESRAALTAVAKEAASQVMRLRAEYELIQQCKFERNPLGIENQAKLVLDWKEPAGAGAKDKKAFHGFKVAAAQELVLLAQNASYGESLTPASLAGSKEQRTAYVRALAEKYPMLDVNRTADRALASIASSKPVGGQDSRKTVLADAGGWARHYFLIANVVMIVALGVMIVVRRRARRLVT